MQVKQNGKWQSMGGTGTVVYKSELNGESRLASNLLNNSLQEIKIEGTSINGIFRDLQENDYYKTGGIRNLPKMDTGKVIDMQHVFNGSDIKSGLELYTLDTRSALFIGGMFYRTRVGLADDGASVLDICNFDLSKVIGADQIFQNAKVDEILLPDMRGVGTKDNKQFRGIKGRDGQSNTKIYVLDKDKKWLEDNTEGESVDIIEYELFSYSVRTKDTKGTWYVLNRKGEEYRRAQVDGEGLVNFGNVPMPIEDYSARKLN